MTDKIHQPSLEVSEQLDDSALPFIPDPPTSTPRFEPSDADEPEILVLTDLIHDGNLAEDPHTSEDLELDLTASSAELGGTEPLLTEPPKAAPTLLSKFRLFSPAPEPDTAVFHPDRDFIISSTKIQAKDIRNYILGRCRDLLGDDYVYGYLYQDGVLSYIALSSPTHDVKKVSVFTPALMHPGSYYLRDGMKYHVVINDGQSIQHFLRYARPEDAVDLQTLPVPEKIPPTLRLQWSLASDFRNIDLILAGVFALCVIMYFLASTQYSALSKQKSTPKATPKAPATAAAALPNLSIVIQEVAKRIDGKGVIKQVKVEKDQLTFVLEFDDENLSREYISVYGGSYENSQVTSTYVSSGIR